MSTLQNTNDKAFKPAQTGNASNPSEKDLTETSGDQLLNEKAEKYLREVSSPEDYPDAQDQQDIDETIEKENK